MYRYIFEVLVEELFPLKLAFQIYLLIHFIFKGKEQEQKLTRELLGCLLSGLSLD